MFYNGHNGVSLCMGGSDASMMVIKDCASCLGGSDASMMVMMEYVLL
jgi:hypothetical protein